MRRMGYGTVLGALAVLGCGVAQPDSTCRVRVTMDAPPPPGLPTTPPGSLARNIPGGPIARTIPAAQIPDATLPGSIARNVPGGTLSRITPAGPFGGSPPFLDSAAARPIHPQGAVLQKPCGVVYSECLARMPLPYQFLCKSDFHDCVTNTTSAAIGRL